MQDGKIAYIKLTGRFGRRYYVTVATHYSDVASSSTGCDAAIMSPETHSLTIMYC